MNLIAKKILGTGLVLGLTAMSLAAQSASQFGNLPLWFEAGQPAKFVAHASDSEFTVSATGAEFSLTKDNGETAVCQLQFSGANPAARISGGQKLTGTINYLHGNDPGQWKSNVPTFAQVQVENLYPGVNLVYYGNRQQLEYDFNLAAGVNPAVIALHFDGAKKVSVNPQGELVIRFHSGEVVQHPPVAYQMVDGARQEIAAVYKMLDAHTAAFAIGQYNQSEPLVIDPVLSFSTFFGGNFGETGWAIAVNTNDGSIYVAGQTFSTKDSNNIPALTFSTPGVIQTNNHSGKLTGDAFIARFDQSGTNLIYATYLGGSGNDGALGLAVDNAGNAYAAGYTDSTNFPTTNAIYNHISGMLNVHVKAYPVDAFVAELNTNGTGLIYSTYLGGNSMDAAFGITLDDAGNAFVTGYTYSTNFPVTTYAKHPYLMCSNTVYYNANAFVTEIAAGGSNLIYSTYLGGTNYDVGRAIAYNSGKLFVTGYTTSTNFPVTNSIPEMAIVWTNYFAKKISGSFTNISGGVTNYGVVITNYFNGQYLNSCSTNKHNARFDTAPDAFVTAFDTIINTNWAVLYSTYLGGTNNDQANGITADDAGNAYVVGFTTSTNFPDTLSGLTSSYVHTNAYIYSYVFATNGFLTKIDYQAGTNATIGYSAMFGGQGLDVANGVARDLAGNIFVVGSASSTNFPVTTNNIGGDLSATNHIIKRRYRSDVFVMAFNADASTNLYSCYIGGWENDYGNAIAVDPLGNAYIVGQTLSTNFPSVNPFQAHRNGTNDMFIAVISWSNSVSVTSNLVLATPSLLTSTPALVIEPENLSLPAIQSKIAGTLPATTPGVSLKWQNSSANYDVESSTDLTPGSWHTVPGSPGYSNGWYRVTLPTTNGVQFFRLHQR